MNTYKDSETRVAREILKQKRILIIDDEDDITMSLRAVLEYYGFEIDSYTEGTNKAILDGLVHGVIVNCVLRMKEHGFDSKVMYLNNVDYYQRDKSNILSPEKIAIAAKCVGIEPKIVFKNLFIQLAYNGAHQLAVAKQVSDFIESKNGVDIKLLVINNLTKFFKESKDKNRAANSLKEVLGILCKACAKHKIALVCTSEANATSCKRYRAFERAPTIFVIQSNFGQTPIRQHSQTRCAVYEESRKHPIIISYHIIPRIREV